MRNVARMIARARGNHSPGAWCYPSPIRAVHIHKIANDALVYDVYNDLCHTVAYMQRT